MRYMKPFSIDLKLTINTKTGEIESVHLPNGKDVTNTAGYDLAFQAMGLDKLREILLECIEDELK